MQLYLHNIQIFLQLNQITIGEVITALKKALIEMSAYRVAQC